MALAYRPPAVAGLFYPGNAAALRNELATLLAARLAHPPATKQPPKALVVPHAGYAYSGSTAAAGYALLTPWRERIRRVILLGPCHRVAVRGLALSPADAFSTPLGPEPLVSDAAMQLSGLPQVGISAAAHAAEHSLEVQLPFLQTVLADFALLPLAVGDASPGEVAAVLERLWGGDETLIVVSTDLSHYLPEALAQQVDAATCDAILSLSALETDQACGAHPLNGLLLAARKHDLKAELIARCTSGDNAGDRERVVGYAAFAFYPSGGRHG